MNAASTDSSTRGPLDHTIRDQIVEAAEQHFKLYGYEKTTVSDLAKAIGFSKAYIYKFFDSKQAIGEVICFNCLHGIEVEVESAMAEAKTASERFRRMFKSLVAGSAKLFSDERKLYDIAASSARERWRTAADYEMWVKKVITDVIREGRDSGEFERKTPLDETSQAIYLVLMPYIHPLLLQHNLHLLDEAPGQLSSLILRSLSP